MTNSTINKETSWDKGWIDARHFDYGNQDQKDLALMRKEVKEQQLNCGMPIMEKMASEYLAGWHAAMMD